MSLWRGAKKPVGHTPCFLLEICISLKDNVDFCFWKKYTVTGNTCKHIIMITPQDFRYRTKQCEKTYKRQTQRRFLPLEIMGWVLRNGYVPWFWLNQHWVALRDLGLTANIELPVFMIFYISSQPFSPAFLSTMWTTCELDSLTLPNGKDFWFCSSPMLFSCEDLPPSFLLENRVQACSYLRQCFTSLVMPVLVIGLTESLRFKFKAGLWVHCQRPFTETSITCKLWNCEHSW